ncbi:MAG: hypothetical protein WCG10_08335 [Chlamydiota bacterium]
MKKHFVMLTFLLSHVPYVHSQDESLQTAQSTQAVGLISAYTCFFNDTTAKTETFLQAVVQTKEYWQKELFQESLPWTRKNPIYWLHKNSYVKLLRKRVALLTDVENQVATLLGIALAGQYELSKNVLHEQDQKEYFIKSIAPLYDHFQIVHGDLATACRQELIQDVQLFSNTVQSEIEKFEKMIAPHKKPHHFVEHQITYASAATALVASLILYEAYKDQIPVWKAHSKEAIENFSHTCLTGPLQGLKEILVDNKDTKIRQIGEEPPFCRHVPWVSIIETPFERSYNSNIDSLNAWTVDKCKALNQYADVAEGIVRSQQINFYLAAIAPMLIATYGAYRCGDKMYDRYVRYDSRYKPMKNMVRSIHRLLNNIHQAQQRSFCDDGKLHVLILKLKSYMYCLSTQELALFQEDIASLLSFDLTYQQKLGVVSSMYKTYGFLE